MRLSEVGSAFPYQQILDGDHPDIAHISREKLDGGKRVDLAVNLALRDVFTDPCIYFAQAIIGTSPEELKETVLGLHYPHFTQRYLHDTEEINKQHQALSYYDRDASYVKKRFNLETPPLKVGSYNEAAMLQSFLNHVWRNASERKIDNDLATGTFENFIWAPSEIAEAKETGVVRTVVMPIGEYGEEVSRKLVQATRVMLQLASRLMPDGADSIMERNEKLIRSETARGRDEHYDLQTNENDYLHQNPLLVTIEEGILSISGSIGLMTAERMAAIDTPDSLIQLIVQRNLPNQLAQHIPMGVVMPLVLAGNYIEGILEIDDDGHLQLSPKILAQLITKNNELLQQAKRHGNIQVDLTEVHIPGLTGLGCPVARKGHTIREAGIEVLSRAFLHVYNSLD